MHRLITQGFPVTENGFPRQEWNILFRIEPDNKIIVQSAIDPNWHKLRSDYLRSQRSKPVTLSTEDFPENKLFRFRLKGNTIKQTQGKHIAIKEPSEQIEYLKRKGSLNGFKLEEVSIDGAETMRGKVKDKPISIHAVTFNGILRVENSELLLQAITKGIGQGKSYGCGLLSLANHRSI